MGKMKPAAARAARRKHIKARARASRASEARSLLRSLDLDEKIKVKPWWETASEEEKKKRELEKAALFGQRYGSKIHDFGQGVDVAGPAKLSIVDAAGKATEIGTVTHLEISYGQA